MVRVWRTHADRTDEGPCPHCIALDGKREGDGWSDPPVDELVGPPPLHPNCECTADEEETATEEFSRAVLGYRHRR